MKFDLAISPCPNDTYIFYAMIHKKNEIYNSSVHYEPVYEDVEELNRRAIQEARHSISKMSYFAYLKCEDTYQIIQAGGALGRGCGPLLIASKKNTDHIKTGQNPGDFIKQTEAPLKLLVPGMSTTAYLLLRMYLSASEIETDRIEIIPVRYEQILPQLAENRADFGLIIHEERFTYPNYGLESFIDLGQWWEDYSGQPIPLGLIAIRRDLSNSYIEEVTSTIRKSLQFSRQNRSIAMPFIRKYAQALEDDAIEKHINLYVNDYSMNPGTEGEQALETMKRLAAQAGLI